MNQTILINCVKLYLALTGVAKINSNCCNDIERSLNKTTLLVKKNCILHLHKIELSSFLTKSHYLQLGSVCFVLLMV